MAKNCQKLVMKLFLTPKTPFFVYRIKKPIYKKCRPYMGLHSCQLPGLLKKLTDLIRPNMSKNVVKKCPNFF